MKSLLDTFLFDLQDNTFKIKNIMKSYNPSTDIVDLSLIDDQMRVIQKRFSYTLKNKVIDDVVIKKRVIPIFNTTTLSKLPSFIPAFLKLEQNRVICLVNLTKYAKMNKEKTELTIDPKTLFTLLQTGSVMLGCYENHNAISMNQNVSKLGSLIYSKLVFKSLDKLFALNLNPIKADQVQYLLGKFFLINLLERSNNKTTTDMALNCCTHGTTKTTLLNFDGMISADRTYNDLQGLVYGLQMIGGLEALSLRQMLNSFIQMYGTSTTMALEFFPLFCHMIFSNVIGAKINSDYLIESVVGKQIDQFYNDVANIIR